MRFSNILPILFFLTIGVFKPAFGADLGDPIVGQWKWFTKSTKVFHADGTLTPTAKGGTWYCANPGELPRKYVITWHSGKFVDTAFLDSDGNHLAGKNQKGDKMSAYRLSREDPDKPANAPDAWNPNLLTDPLLPYIRNLSGLLSLQRTGNKETMEFFGQASGSLIVVRQAIAAEREKASEQNVAAFNAALKTCDLLSAALAERSKTLGDLQTSGAVVNDGKLEGPARKDNLAQGIKSDGARIDVGRAAAVAAERDREKQFQQQAAARAANSDHALTAMAENQWNKRSAEWMGQIAAVYGEIK